MTDGRRDKLESNWKNIYNYYGTTAKEAESFFSEKSQIEMFGKYDKDECDFCLELAIVNSGKYKKQIKE